MSTTLYAAQLSDDSCWWSRTAEDLARFAAERGTPPTAPIIPFEYEGLVVDEWEEGGGGIIDAAEDALCSAYGPLPGCEM